jgi:Raf kinase inhibitor-like YbhB/YbcL family protein
MLLSVVLFSGLVSACQADVAHAPSSNDLAPTADAGSLGPDAAAVEQEAVVEPDATAQEDEATRAADAEEEDTPGAESAGQAPEGSDEMKLTSTAFGEGELIPKLYSCDGDDISPPLEWSGAPRGTKSFALIVDDPDAPMGTWVHWVLYDLPPDQSALPQGVDKTDLPLQGGVHGSNSWKRNDYGGPCPPGGTHRYYFKLYALDEVLGLGAGATADEVSSAMQGHILAEAQLMGRYGR